MKYIISRASECNEEIKPCEGAVLETLVATNTYVSEEAPGYYKAKLNPNNFNFREEDGKFKCDFYKNLWTIEINSLEDLMKLYDKYGDLIIQDSIWCENIPEIKIYDDYIE